MMLQLARATPRAHAAVLLVRQDRRTLQGGTQDFAVERDLAVGTDRDHRLVVREAAVDQLAGEGHVVALHAQVVAADFELELAVAAFEQALQFLHALARHDDLALGLRAVRPAAASHSARRWPSVATQRSAVVAQVEQQAVEVVAHVLLRHREGGALDQFLRAPASGTRTRSVGFDLVDRREVVRRQARQGEAAATGLRP